VFVLDGREGGGRVSDSEPGPTRQCRKLDRRRSRSAALQAPPQQAVGDLAHRLAGALALPFDEGGEIVIDR
jgi:hypothetical protein